MPISDIVTVTISTTSKGVTRAGFGVPLVAAYHALYVDRVRSYTTLAAMVTDGFTANDPAYKAVSKIMGQTPRPETVKVGRRALPMDQVIQLAPTSNTVNTIHTATITSRAGLETTVTKTVTAGETIADITAALQTSIDAITGVTCTDNSTFVECNTDNSGEIFFYNSLNDELELTDVTADPGIATDLAAIELADPAYYGVAIDSNSEAEIKAAQAYVETLEKIAGYHSCDAGVRDSGVSDDVASDLEALSYARCVLMSSKHHDGYAGAAWLGRIFPQNPGRSTWAYKTLTGVTVDSLNTTQSATILGKGCNIYTTVFGLNLTENGQTPDGTFIDIIRGRDWFTARLRERVVQLLANTAKVPYTDDGVDMFTALVDAQFEEAISPAYGYIDGAAGYTVTAPKVADVSTVNKANRLLPDIFFSGTLQGAIHKVEFTGTLSV